MNEYNRGCKWIRVAWIDISIYNSVYVRYTSCIVIVINKLNLVFQNKALLHRHVFPSHVTYVTIYHVKVCLAREGGYQRKQHIKVGILNKKSRVPISQKQEMTFLPRKQNEETD